MVFSAFISLTEWDIVTKAKFIGLENFKAMANDPVLWKSLRVTAYYTVINVPFVVLVSFLGANLLNAKRVRFLKVFRTIYYIPSIVPAVASSALWVYIFNPNLGIANKLLALVGIPKQMWIYAPNFVVPSIVLMGVWAAGNSVVIYLAGLQGISKELYESAGLDGAGPLRQFLHVTIPMMTPLIFYNVVIGVISSLQIFTQAYVMTNGGPNNASLFVMLLLYRTAFTYGKMGYASAIAWLIFIVIALGTIAVFRTSNLWVFYQGEVRGRKR